MNLSNKTHQKLITFSNTLLQLGEQRANHLGISFAEYIRHLIIIDSEKTMAPMVDEVTGKAVHQSLKEYAQGIYQEFDPSDPNQLRQVAGSSV